MSDKKKVGKEDVLDWGDFLEDRVKRQSRMFETNISSIRLSYDGYKWLAVVSARVKGRAQVAFLSDTRLGRLLEAVEEALWKNNLVWKDDKYRS